MDFRKIAAIDYENILQQKFPDLWYTLFKSLYSRSILHLAVHLDTLIKACHGVRSSLSKTVTSIESPLPPTYGEVKRILLTIITQYSSTHSGH